MSIKRTRTKVERRPSNEGSERGPSISTAKGRELTWREAIADRPDSAFVSYPGNGLFSAGTLLEHPKFGKGLVLSVEGKKMEVLFSEGKKLLAIGAVLVPRSKSDD